MPNGFAPRIDVGMSRWVLELVMGEGGKREAEDVWEKGLKALEMVDIAGFRRPPKQNPNRLE